MNRTICKVYQSQPPVVEQHILTCVSRPTASSLIRAAGEGGDRKGRAGGRLTSSAIFRGILGNKGNTQMTRMRSCDIQEHTSNKLVISI